jgi:plasmid stabilization system protein ParE
MVKMQIEWTGTAKKNVRRIYLFYCKIASEKIARQMVEPLFPFVKSLLDSPLIGQEEPDLKIKNQGQRYLVNGHNKIVYRVKEDVIYITHVFDTRQNPKKLK